MIYAVIADDLTGANDAGVQFTSAGLHTRVLIEKSLLQGIKGADVVVIDSDTRGLKPEKAYSTVADISKRVDSLSLKIVYKKIDSTMRGNVGYEIDAIMDSTNVKLAIVCPAFPKLGRIVVGGYLLVDNVPVSRSAIAKDPRTPVKESYLPMFLSKQTKRTVHHVTLRTIENGATSTFKELSSARGSGNIFLCDAADDNDLETIVKAGFELSRKNEKVLLVGSAGMARFLAKALAAGSSNKKRETSTLRAKKGTILVVVGSLNPTSRAQLSYLTSQFRCLELKTDTNLTNEEALHAVERTKQESFHKIITLTTPEHIIASDPPEENNSPQRIAQILANIACSIIRSIKVKGLVIVGGDTAHALLSHLGSEGVDLVSEVLPGIPIGTLVSGEFSGMPIITKAGGFGEIDALVKTVEYLKKL